MNCFFLSSEVFQKEQNTESQRSLNYAYDIGTFLQKLSLSGISACDSAVMLRKDLSEAFKVNCRFDTRGEL